MGVTAITSDAEPAAAVAFTAAVRDALPDPGFWTMPVLAAVSGGGDSVALVLALRRLVPADAVHRLVVVHAEHDLRPEAGDDRLFVERLAARLGLACESRRLPVRPARGEGVEAAARRLRYGFMMETAAAIGARHVVVAHTADDQAETILHRLLRGTGVAGLAGMSRARELAPGTSLLRPLLGMRRAAARAFLTAIGQPWREDATNADVRHARNFVRHEILARCEEGAYPACIESIVRLGGQAAVQAAALASAADRLLEEHGRHERQGVIALDASRLAGLDPHLVAEVFVALWRREGWPQRAMSAAHYASLARLTAGVGTTAVLPGAVHVETDGRTMRLERRF